MLFHWLFLVVFSAPLTVPVAAMHRKSPALRGAACSGGGAAAAASASSGAASVLERQQEVHAPGSEEEEEEEEDGDEEQQGDDQDESPDAGVRQFREHGTGNKVSTNKRYATFLDPSKKWMKACIFRREI